MFKKIIAFMLVLSMSLTLFACGNENTGDADNKDNDSGKEDVQDNGGNDNIESGSKIGTLSLTLDSIVQYSSGGVLYNVGDKYGIMSLDGKNDTGAKYMRADSEGDYFTVSSTAITERTLACANSLGLVDGNGREIIPQKYTVIEVLNDRYARVIETTEFTDNRDEALAYLNVGIVINLGNSDELKCKGVWYIYDLTTGKPVVGVSASNNYPVTVTGEFIEYYKDDNTKACVDSNGSPVSKDTTKIFADGSYKVTDGENVTVYDSEGNKLFTCTSDEYVPIDHSTKYDYFIARKAGAESSVYAAMDESGKVISSDVNSQIIDVVGELLVDFDHKVYNFKGENIVDGEFYTVKFDEKSGCYYLEAFSDGEDMLIKADGTVLCRGTDDKLNFDTNPYFSVHKVNSDSLNYTYDFYCHADNDFTIKGESLAPYLVKVEADELTYDVVDTITGKTVISGYANYKYAQSADGAVYIYAMTADGNVDIYLVK